MATENVKNQSARAVRPRVDVYENEEELLVLADLPGVKKDGVEVRFEAGELHVSAERPYVPAGAPLAEEYRAAPFARAFAMPEGIDAEKIDATLDKGVLTVRLPKVAAKKPRKIEVRATAT